MNGINVNLWAMRSELDNAVNQYNMGWITRVSSLTCASMQESLTWE